MESYAAVIVTHNRYRLLKECIGCVLGQSLPFAQIIIVDNCSSDDTAAYLKTTEAINVYHLPENIGGAGGFSYGLTKLRTEINWVLLIDDDAMLNRDYLKNIRKYIDKDCMAYTGCVYTEGKIDLSHHRRLKNATFMRREDVPLSEYKKPYFMYTLSSFCGLLLNTKLIQHIGLPKAEYFIWCDDTEYSLRISKLTSIKNVNTATLNHKINVKEKRRLSWKSYYGYRNAIEIGKNFSKHRELFLCYRYLYHVYRILYFFVKYICGQGNNKQYFNYCIRLHKDVLLDSIKGALGKNEKYLPEIK